jgi:hypothetical protein
MCKDQEAQDAFTRIPGRLGPSGPVARFPDQAQRRAILVDANLSLFMSHEGWIRFLQISEIELDEAIQWNPLR